MNIKTLQCLLIAIPIAVAGALSGCGGGGSSVTPPEPPVNAETERLNAALQRAQVAENAAWSSAAQASLQCQAVPAACQAAQDATTAALLAEGANERAQNAMTAAEAERAADIAEQGASRAATAAADAVRLAAAGEGQQPEPPTTVDPADWLLSGTVESAAARDQAVSKIAAIQATNPGPSGGTFPFRLRVPVVDSYWTNHWGYWNHPSLSGDITKVQRIVYNIVEYDNSRILSGRSILGLMDHGYFGITHAPHFSGTGTGGAFYETDHTIEGSLPLKSLNLLGARWTGDAFAIKVPFADATDFPFFGTATLKITGENRARGVSYEYRVDFDVTLNNGYTLQINGEASNNNTEIHRFSYNFGGAEFRTATSQEPDGGWVGFGGLFAGPQAQEVIGTFETPTYKGGFGGKRDNE